MNPRIIRFAALLLLQATALLAPALPVHASNIATRMILLVSPALEVQVPAESR